MLARPEVKAQSPGDDPEVPALLLTSVHVITQHLSPWQTSGKSTLFGLLPGNNQPRYHGLDIPI